MELKSIRIFIVAGIISLLMACGNKQQQQQVPPPPAVTVEEVKVPMLPIMMNIPAPL